MSYVEKDEKKKAIKRDDRPVRGRVINKVHVPACRILHEIFEKNDIILYCEYIYIYIYVFSNAITTQCINIHRQGIEKFKVMFSIEFYCVFM